mmetsp:Transcript_29928/g.67676  ORF Transcript_29928/g.67676 Transcript_29928/m.67676 type:complete len:243 (-) Transcript_29928:29-757(-)
MFFFRSASPSFTTSGCCFLISSSRSASFSARWFWRCTIFCRPTFSASSLAARARPPRGADDARRLGSELEPFEVLTVGRRADDGCEPPVVGVATSGPRTARRSVRRPALSSSSSRMPFELPSSLSKSWSTVSAVAPSSSTLIFSRKSLRESPPLPFVSHCFIQSTARRLSFEKTSPSPMISWLTCAVSFPVLMFSASENAARLREGRFAPASLVPPGVSRGWETSFGGILLVFTASFRRPYG